MAKKIFITATNTDIGKTYTTKLLLKEFASRGIRVGVIKPMETGVIDGYAPDGEELLACMKDMNDEAKNLSIKDVVPITYKLPSAPFIASNNKKVDLNKIKKTIKNMERYCDILFIEGVGGLFVPLDGDYMVVDLIEYLDASTLLVTHCSLGCINDTLLSKKVLQDRDISHIIAFNCREDDESFKNISEPYFEHVGIKVLKTSQNIDTICDVLYNL